MADNVPLPPSGVSAATDEIGGAHIQWVKIKFGADGTATAVDGDNPLPTVGASLSQADAGLDANSTSTVGTALALAGAKRVALQVDGASGAHTTHVVTIQVSADGTTYHNSSGTVTGEGIVEIDTGFAYARPAVTTAEGAASTIDIVLQAK